MTISELQGAAEAQARASVAQATQRWQLEGIPAQAVPGLILNEILVQALIGNLMLAHIGVVVGAIAPDPPQVQVEEPAKPGRIIMEH